MDFKKHKKKKPLTKTGKIDDRLLATLQQQAMGPLAIQQDPLISALATNWRPAIVASGMLSAGQKAKDLFSKEKPQFADLISMLGSMYAISPIGGKFAQWK